MSIERCQTVIVHRCEDVIQQEPHSNPAICSPQKICSKHQAGFVWLHQEILHINRCFSYIHECKSGAECIKPMAEGIEAIYIFSAVKPLGNP
jgi:hypothetical protein